MHLEAYRHQVGGHSQFMKPRNSSKVFKPLIQNEGIFYETLLHLDDDGAIDVGPLHILKRFVPKYYGLTTCILHKYPLLHQPQYPLSQVTIVPPPARRARNLRTHSEPPVYSMQSFVKTSIQRKVTRRSQSVSIIGRQFQFFKKERFGNGHSQIPTKSAYHAVVKEDVSSFLLSTLQSELSTFKKLKDTDVNSTTELVCHIVLEDLAYGFAKPCVMDIKMGRRQRKLGASMEKEKRQLQKSLKSSSHSVGFRICGCQFYNKKIDLSCYQDKYWGRNLTVESIPSAFKNWFWNGYQVDYDLVIILISKLRRLYACISKLRHYRFWSSSLLWVYDGALENKRDLCNSLDVRMIDFANTIFLQDNPAPDEEYLFGLYNLINALESVLKK